MKRNKIILICVLLLIIIVGFSYLIFSSFNSHDNLNITNNTTNNSIINSTLNVNKSVNTSDNDNLNDDSSYSESSSDSYSSYNSYSSSSGYSSSKSKSDDFNEEYSASDAKKAVKKYLGDVAGKDISKIKISKPKFKDSDGSWLVPIYDKKTGKFLDSVHAYDNGKLSGGKDVYNNYKRVSSGKEPKKSKFKHPISENR